MRGLVEFSNVCRRNCRYCGLRAANRQLVRYTLSKDEIMETATEAVTAGADTLVLQAGEYAVPPQWLAGVVDAIRRDLRVPVTLSVGEQPRTACALWKEATGRILYVCTAGSLRCCFQCESYRSMSWVLRFGFGFCVLPSA